MTWVAVGEAIVILTLIALIHSFEASHSQERRDRADAHERVVSEMANRIQRPEIIPGPVTEFVVPDMPEDEFELVGVIQDPPSEAQ